MSDSEARPRVIAIALAGLAPIVMSVAAITMLGAAAGPAGMWATFMEAGFPAWLVLASSVVGALVIAGLLAASAHGWRVPSALTIGFAALPWLLGVFGTSWSLRIVEAALSGATVDPSQRARIMAIGISEASANRLLGCTFSAALLAAVAIGFGVAALGRRTEGRRGSGAIVGSVAALPLVACAGYALSGGFSAAPVLLVGVVALVAGVGVALAGAAAGEDEPSARAATLCSAAPIAAGLALVAGAAATTTSGVRLVFGALAAVDPVQRSNLAATGASELAPAFWVERWGAAVALLGAVALGAWALRFVKPTGRRVAGAVAVCLVAAGVIATDALVRNRVLGKLASVTEPPWHSVTGFSPLELHADPFAGDVHAIVAAETIHFQSGDPIRLDAPERRSDIIEGLRSAMTRGSGELLRPEEPPEPGEPTAPSGTREQGAMGKPLRRYGVRPPGDTGDPVLARNRALADAAEFGMLGLLNASGGRDAPIAEPSLKLAVDARLGAPTLKKLLALAGEAGARSVTLVGTQPMTEAQAARVAEARRFPLLAPIAEPPLSAQLLFLESSLRPGAADRDAMLWHGTIAADGDALRLECRKGAGDPVTIPPLAPDEVRVAPPRGAPRVAYLLLGAAATTQTLASVARRAERHNFTPVVLAGDTVPGRPSEPLAATGFGTGAGGLDGHGTGGRSPSVRMGSLSVSGRLPPEVIQRIVRQNFGRFRVCYESGLKIDPKLEGRVSVRFVIGRDGSVSSVADAGSDLKSSTVVACVIRAFHGLSFPEPEGGIVTVVYPILFSPPS